MRVQLFSRSGAVVATVEVDSHAEAVMLLGILYVLKNGVFRETDISTIISWEKPE